MLISLGAGPVLNCFWIIQIGGCLCSTENSMPFILLKSKTKYICSNVLHLLHTKELQLFFPMAVLILYMSFAYRLVHYYNFYLKMETMKSNQEPFVCFEYLLLSEKGFCQSLLLYRAFDIFQYRQPIHISPLKTNRFFYLH